MTGYPESVEAAFTPSGATPPLRDFLKAMEYDDNTVWRLDQGHIANLLEEVVDELELAEREIEHYKSLYESLAAIHTPYRLREGRIPSPRERLRIREILKGEGL